MNTIIIPLISDVAIYVWLPLGLWLSFRVLGYPDLSIEQLFVMGGVIFSTCCLYIQEPYRLYVLIISILMFSMIMGIVCSVIRNKYKVNPILISLILSYFYYSISLVLLKQPNLYLGYIIAMPSYLMIVLTSIFLFITVLSVLLIFSYTRIGLVIISSGANYELAKRHKLSPVLWQGIGLGISFLLSMISGVLFTWKSINVDITNGANLLLISLFVVISTRACQKRIKVFYNSLLLILFTLLYLLIIQLLYYWGMPTQWLKGVNAIMLFILVLVLSFKKQQVKFSL